MRTGPRPASEVETIELIDIDDRAFGFTPASEAPATTTIDSARKRRRIAAAALGGTVALFAAGVAISRPSGTPTPLPTSPSARTVSVVASTTADPAATDPASTEPVSTEALFAPDAGLPVLVPVIPDGYEVAEIRIQIRKQ